MSRRKASSAGRSRSCAPATRSKWMPTRAASTCTSPTRNSRADARRGSRRRRTIPAATARCTPPTSARPPKPANPPSAMEPRIQALAPDLEAYTSSAMKAFDVPGLAIGIVAGDRLVYAKGFGVRSKAGGAPVDTGTVFQIGSAAKAFLAATMGIMVDRGKFRWDDRVVDLDPEFQLKDPWVTREFR